MSDSCPDTQNALADAPRRDRLSLLAEQQAALRRVATLVARAASPSEVFAAVADEIVNSLHVDNSAVRRFEREGTQTFVAVHHQPGLDDSLFGSRWPLDGTDVGSMVFRTGRAARLASYANPTGPLEARARELGFRCVVGVPVVVDGTLWGITNAASPNALPADTEERLGEFGELVAMGIAAAIARAELEESRDELLASRARIVAAADDARRRLERDLHDGAQQRLVSLGLQARLLEDSFPPELQSFKEELSGLASGLTALSAELQEISRGIHPAILSDGGLGPALKTLARRCPIPANIDVLVEGRLPESVEVAAYYVVAEALTNAAKYSQAANVNVCAEVKEGKLCLSVQDDGIGGADSRNGSGLIGLKDRVEVVGGHMKVISPLGIGTSLHVTIPLAG